MKKKEFKSLFKDLTCEILDYNVTPYEERYFWNHFKRLSDDLKCDLSAAWELEEMVHFDPTEILHFRNVLATMGTELTIRQAEIWLVMLEILLISVDFYQWEQPVDR